MRRATIMVVLMCLIGVGRAEEVDAETAHAEMARALAAQADVHPTPATLPTVAAAPQHAAAQSAVKRGVAAHGNGPGNGNGAANANANAAQGQAQAAAAQAAHGAQGAAASAAGQAQAAAAKARAASHPHPGK